MEGLAMGKYKITRDKFLSGDEVRRLLKVSQELSDLDILKGRQTWVTRHMLVSFALRTGLRVSEIANLKLSDIHMGKESYLIVRAGKGGKDRTVYFNGGLVKHLKIYLDIKVKTWREKSDYLFSHNGKPFTPTALHISFKKACERAGINGHSIHDARHTYATHLLSDTGGNIRYVQRQLGHENIAHTALYADILPEVNQKLADKLSI